MQCCSLFFFFSFFGIVYLTYCILQYILRSCCKWIHSAGYIVIRNLLVIVYIRRLNDWACYVMLTRVMNQTECCKNYNTMSARFLQLNFWLANTQISYRDGISRQMQYNNSSTSFACISCLFCPKLIGSMRSPAVTSDAEKCRLCNN